MFDARAHTAPPGRFAPFVQLAYHTPDPAAAAAAWSARTGAGPFLLRRSIPLAGSRHRGVERTFDHSSAYGWQGGLMIELVTQAGDTPSALRDMFAAHQTGLHHAAILVDGLDAAIAAADANGWPVAQDSVTADGVRFVFVDARSSYGHMLELYEPSEGLARFYAHVARLADGWDGADPVREVSGR